MNKLKHLEIKIVLTFTEHRKEYRKYFKPTPLINRMHLATTRVLFKPQPLMKTFFLERDFWKIRPDAIATNIILFFITSVSQSNIITISCEIPLWGATFPTTALVNDDMHLFFAGKAPQINMFVSGKATGFIGSVLSADARMRQNY